MWVRTQDKETLVKADKLYIDKNNNKYTINFDSCTDRWYILGTYKSKERAIEVLDEVEKKINLINLGHDFGSPMIDLKNPTYIYQMPNE